MYEVLGHAKVWREGELARPDPMQLLDDAKEGSKGARLVRALRQTLVQISSKSMKFQYDLQADAFYILMASGKAAKTEQVRTNLMVDYDENNKILGIEILYVSETAENLREMVLEMAGSKDTDERIAVCSINIPATF